MYPLFLYSSTYPAKFKYPERYDKQTKHCSCEIKFGAEMLFSEEQQKKNKIVQYHSAKIYYCKDTAFCLARILEHEHQNIRSGNSQSNIDDSLRYIEIPFERLFFKEELARADKQDCKNCHTRQYVEKYIQNILSPFQTVIQMNGAHSPSSHSKTLFITSSGTAIQPSVGVFPQCMKIAEGFSVSGSDIL